jgi:hypothetical protein
MNRTCRCGGSNENCVFCFGSGTVQGEPSFTPVPSYDINPTVQPLSGGYRSKADARLGGSGLHAADTFGVPSYGTVGRNAKRKKRNRQPPTAGTPTASPTTPTNVSVSQSSTTLFTYCKICNARVLNKNVVRHLRKAHSDRPGPTPTRQKSTGPDPRQTAVPDTEFQNPILHDRLNRALDATRDYAHTFRESGRFGSHPAHDDFSDEGQA